MDESLYLGPFATSLGLVLDTANGDEVTAHWTVTPEMHQPYGILHGGVHCSVVETLASVGAALWLGDRGKVVGRLEHHRLLPRLLRGQPHLGRSTAAQGQVPAGLAGGDPRRPGSHRGTGPGPSAEPEPVASSLAGAAQGRPSSMATPCPTPTHSVAMA